MPFVLLLLSTLQLTAPQDRNSLRLPQIVCVGFAGPKCQATYASVEAAMASAPDGSAIYLDPHMNNFLIVGQQHIEERLRKELEKRNPDLALQWDLQDRLKKHFERPPAKEALKSDHVRSI